MRQRNSLITSRDFAVARQRHLKCLVNINVFAEAENIKCRLAVSPVFRRHQYFPTVLFEKNSSSQVSKYHGHVAVFQYAGGVKIFVCFHLFIFV